MSKKIKKLEKKSCFIIMPFSKAQLKGAVLDEKTLLYIYENVIHKAVAEYREKNKRVFINISRYNSKIGSIVSGITSSLNDADLVVADLTGLNPNVMYELGVRHTLKRGTIIITQDLSQIPSDLRDYMCVEYSYSNDTLKQNELYEKFKKELHHTIQELFETEKYDSPVLSYLKGREKYWKEDELKKLKENIVIGNYIFERYNNIQSLLSTVRQDDGFLPLNQLGLFSSLINNFGNAIAEFNIAIEASILFEDIHAAKSVAMDMSKVISITEYFDSLNSALPNDAGVMFPSSINLNNKFILNYFKLHEGVFDSLSINEVFSKKGDFYIHFMGGIEEYLESKAKEIGLSKKEIEKILTN
jgi:hypothetical protein